MITLIPYDKAHMDIFEQMPQDIERYGKLDSKSPNPLAEYGVSFTGISEGRILIIGGILQASLHTGTCWTMVSAYAKGRRAELIELVKTQLERMMNDMGLHRVETSNLADAVKHHEWCKELGFVEEGEMRYYDDQKRTYIRFAKLLEG